MKLHNFNFGEKLLYHPEQIVSYKAGVRPFPVTLEVDLTNICNHDCSFCFYADHLKNSNSKLDLKILKERLTEAKELGTKGISFTGGGEPMAHSEFIEILEHSNNIGLSNGLMTNGSLIRKTNIDALMKYLQWIRISMGGGSRTSYINMQGRDHFNRVIDNIRLLSEEKSKTHSRLNIGIRILVTENNIESIIDMAQNIKEFNINYLQVAPDHLGKDGGVFWNSVSTQEVFREVEGVLENSGKQLLTASYFLNQDKLHIPKTCYAHFYKTVLVAEGDLMFCQMCRGSSKYAIGNIYDNTFTEIWNGQKNKDLESWVRPSNCGIFCKSMLVNLGIEEALYPNPDMSPNFF